MQVLEADRRAAPVAGEQGEPGGEAGPGAVAPQGDPVGPQTVGGGAAGDPLQCGVAVLQGRRVGVFGGQPVVDGHHEDSQFAAEPQVVPVVDVEVPEDEPAAVQAAQDGQRTAHTLRAVGAQRDVGGTGRARYEQVGDRDAGVVGPLHGAGQFGGLGRAGGAEVGEVDLDGHGQRGGELGVEAVPHGGLPRRRGPVDGAPDRTCQPYAAAPDPSRPSGWDPAAAGLFACVP